MPSAKKKNYLPSKLNIGTRYAHICLHQHDQEGSSKSL